MKKKGLLISTIAMVVVLIAALTTSTYAWFTASSKTTIEGFDVQVVASNAVNIGVMKENKHIAPNTVSTNDFLYGDVTWINNTVGTLGENAGSWTNGTAGLGATLNHNIAWGEQSKSVGAINESSSTNVSSMTDSTKYGFIGNTGSTTNGKANNASDGQTTYINAANLSSGTTLTEPTAAYANNKYTSSTSTDVQSGDYAYLFLGAAPAETLTNNELIIMVDANGSSGTIVGILASLHVAYRVTRSNDSSAATTWEEKEFFTADCLDSLASATYSWTDAEKIAYKTAFDTDAPTSKVGVVKIEGLSEEQGDIDQIELVIYMAGPDDDCIDAGKGASGQIKMFFATESATKTTKPTNATIDNSGILTLTGVEGAEVYVDIDNAGYNKVSTGKWTNNSYSSQSSIFGDTVPSSATVKVKIKLPSNADSEEITINFSKTA